MVRLFTLARVLGEPPHGVALRALAERHAWNLRTLYRDIEVLERAGLPVAHDGSRFRLLEGWLPPGAGRIQRDEIMALFAARQLAEGVRQTSLGRSLERLWGRLTASGAHAGRLVPDAAPWLAVRSPLGIDYSRHRDTIGTLEYAVSNHLAVNCRYAAASSGALTARVIEPGELYFDPRLESLYLIAWCRLREDVRVFAVHRFRLVALTDEPCARRPGVTSKAALRDAFRVWRSGHVTRVRVRFSRSLAGEIRERTWHPSQRLASRPDGGVDVTLEVAGLAEVSRWVLGFGAGALALGPPELRRAVRAELRAAAAGYHARRRTPGRGRPRRGEKV
ncbi:MAG: WYL domain-containing protein [Deltaproteobacteria bacterium]|nr:WYL domain-containing protein [Deltaproteobacteria bacterium]